MLDPNAAKFDHLVALMLENRSFDNLLGYVYQEGAPRRFIGRGEPVFRGVAGQEGLCNEHDGQRVCVHPAPFQDPVDMCQPSPDPGEEYRPHVNCQLYGVDDVRDLDPLPDPAPMDGFLKDYARVLGKDGSKAGGDHPGRIMQCFTPEAVPVLNELGRQFAVSDEWFASVPTQTLPNRSFLQSGQSNDWVHNAPYLKWALNVRPTVFERLADKLGRRSWRVYWDPKDFFSLTKHLHTQLLEPKWWCNFRHMKRFRRDCAKGKLPAYTVVEPRLFFDHNDMHPPLGLTAKGASSVLAGELLVADVYRALRDSPLWKRTLLVVLFDEHGGCYDHWPPPGGATPPYPEGSSPRHHRGPNEDPFGFGFDRFGVRVPALFISPYVDRGTVVRSPGAVPFDHTSVIRTLSTRWGLEPLTDRDANAPDFNEVLALETPRSDAPSVNPRPYPGISAGWEETPLHELQQGMISLVSRVHGRPSGDVVHNLGSGLDHLASVRRRHWWTSLRRAFRS